MDCFSPPHKQEIIFCILNKTTPLAKIKSLTEAAYLGLLCTTAGHKLQGFSSRGLQG